MSILSARMHFPFSLGRCAAYLKLISESAFRIITSLTKFPHYFHVSRHSTTEVLGHGQLCAPGMCGNDWRPFLLSLGEYAACT